MSTTDDTTREPPVYLTLVRPRCPDCNSPHFRAYHTDDNGDDSKTRYSTCQSCGRKVIIIVE